MACICEQFASSTTLLASACIGQPWFFKDLSPEESGALTKEAFRKGFSPGENIFFRALLPVKCFSSRQGG